MFCCRAFVLFLSSEKERQQAVWYLSEHTLLIHRCLGTEPCGPVSSRVGPLGTVWNRPRCCVSSCSIVSDIRSSDGLQPPTSPQPPSCSSQLTPRLSVLTDLSPCRYDPVCLSSALSLSLFLFPLHPLSLILCWHLADGGSNRGFH